MKEALTADQRFLQISASCKSALPADLRLCQACEDGDHGNCGLQHWCECQDERDGDRDAPPDHGPACPCNACINAEIAENDND